MDVPERGRPAGAGIRNEIANLRSTVVVAAPGAVLLLALALVGLTAMDAWMDEACSIAATVQLRTVLRATSGTMATYYVLLSGWIRISDALWWIRLLSVISALVAMVLTARFAVQVRGARVGRLACLVLGASFLMVRYAREARSFTLVLVVVAASWLVLDRLVRRPDRWGLVAVHVMLGAVVPLTHGLATIALLAQVLAVIAARPGRRVWLAVVPGWGLSVLVVGALFRLGASGVGAGNPFTFDGAREVGLRVAGGIRWSGTGAFDVRYVLAGFLGAGLVVAIRRYRSAVDVIERYLAAAPVAWAFGTVGGLVVLSAARPVLMDRYAIAAIPAVVVLQADAAVSLHRLLARWLGVRWGRVPLVPAMLVALMLVAQVPLHRNHDHTWRDMVEVLADEAEPGDTIFVPRPAGRLMLDYAWTQGSDLPVLRSLSPTHPLGRVQRYGSRLPLDEAMEHLDGVDRLWVVQVPLGGKDQAYVDARYHPALAWGFEPVRVHRFRSASLVLMVRKR